MQGGSTNPINHEASMVNRHPNNGLQDLGNKSKATIKVKRNLGDTHSITNSQPYS
jgi:hypothetical protein